MRNLMALSTLALTFGSGCVVYDGYGEGDCDWDGDCFTEPELDCDLDENENGVADCDEQDEEEAVAVELSFSPNHAERGEVFPAVITLDEGEFDLSLVEEVVFFGGVDVLSATATYDRMVLVLQVAEDAQLGAVDVALDAGDAGEVLDGALVIHEADSGNSALDWTDGSDDDCE